MHPIGQQGKAYGCNAQTQTASQLLHHNSSIEQLVISPQPVVVTEVWFRFLLRDLFPADFDILMRPFKQKCFQTPLKS